MKKNLLDGIEAHTEDLMTQSSQNKRSQDAMQAVLDVVGIGLERVSSIVHNMSIGDASDYSTQQSYNINHCIESVSEKFAKDLPPNIHLELSLSKLPKVYVDTYKIQQLLLNLLTNALEAIECEGVIVVSSKQQGGYLQIAVADNGCGIASCLQEAIFDPSFSGHKSVESTGLGLAISRDIAIEYGGQLCVESTLGEGSVFTLLLPTNKLVIH